MSDSDRPKVIGNGSVYEVKEGVFQYRFNLDKDPVTGKYAYSPKRTLHCEGKSKQTQQAMLRRTLEEYKEELNSGIVRRGKDRDVSEYARDFHTLREGTMGSPLAYEREGYDIRHIEELFGNIRLKNLKPDDIRHAYAEARKAGRFSESEIRRIHVKLKQIMQDAVDNELIDRNPCNGIKLPRQNVEDRVGGAPLVGTPSSHATVRTVRYTAVPLTYTYLFVVVREEKIAFTT